MSRRFLYSLLLFAAAAATCGCTNIAEDVATHLIKHDFKAIDHDLTVFKGDLALFRGCLKERGGSCQGSDTTALVHSSQHAASQPVTPLTPGSSQVLADSVNQLPAGHPAKTAHAVLSHPVVQQAAAVHNHLRGHAGAEVPGVSITQDKPSGGAPLPSTVTMDLKIGKSQHLHHRLLASIGTTAWDSLHKHCRTVASKHQTDAELAADCRRATFIRGYLGAYFRNGEFLEVDVQLAGAISTLNSGATKIEAKIQSLQNDVTRLEQDVTTDAQQAVSDLSSDAGGVSTDVAHLLGKVEGMLSKHFGSEVSDIFSHLSSLATQVETQAQNLANSAATAAGSDVTRLATAINSALGSIDTDLGKLRTKVGTVDQDLVNHINAGLQDADHALSNVFKVTNTGFVSRDATFSARLPTIEVTVDPTVKRWVSFKDVDTSQVVTGHSDLGHLGVATDTSGVGTGASIGAEILRVFLEAIYDAQEGLPAVYPANTPNLKPTGLALKADSLPAFTTSMGHVSARDLTKMTALNDRVATQTRVTLTRAIEGIGPFSLNNQALESFLVELVTTSIRKAAEKASWCFYACNLDGDLDQLRTDAEKAAKDVETAAKDKVHEEAAEIKAAAEKAKEKADAELKDAEQKAKAWASREGEHVKLRLKLSK